MSTGSPRQGTAGGAFARFLIRRALLAVVVVLGVVVITFFLSRVVPANVAGLWAGTHATAQDLANARAELHLDDPLPVQFWYYLSGVLQGDLGKNVINHHPVSQDIATYLPATLELISSAVLLALLIGIPLGVLIGMKEFRGKRLIKTIFTTLIGIPTV
jgi:peptide/nickel transport system permease protein